MVVVVLTVYVYLNLVLVHCGSVIVVVVRASPLVFVSTSSKLEFRAARLKRQIDKTEGSTYVDTVMVAGSPGIVVVTSEATAVTRMVDVYVYQAMLAKKILQLGAGRNQAVKKHLQDRKPSSQLDPV